MLISIIIPIFKVEPYIKRCLESVLCQTYRNLEVILVDDCTPDRSMELAKDYIANSPLSKDLHFVYLKHDHNRGLSAARNTGMDAATGDYIYFLDSDDEITPLCIEKLASTLTEEQYDLVVGDLQKIIDGKEIYDSCLQLKLQDGEVLRDNRIQQTYLTKWNMMAQNKLYKTDFLRSQQIQFIEGLIHEDELWSIQISCLAQSLRAVGDYTYLYYVRPGSITTAININKREEAFKTIIAETCNFLISREIYSPHSYQIVHLFEKELLWDRRNNRQQFIDTYIELRKRAPWPKWYRIKVNGWNFLCQLKNSHNFFPPQLGAYLLFFYFSLKRDVPL